MQKKKKEKMTIASARDCIVTGMIGVIDVTLCVYESQTHNCILYRIIINKTEINWHFLTQYLQIFH